MLRRFFRRPSLSRPAPASMVASYLVLCLWALVVLFPLYWLVVTSLKLPVHVSRGPLYLPFVDFQPSLHAWRFIFQDIRGDVLRPYLNTVVVSLTSSLLGLTLGTLAAYGLARFSYRPRLGGVLAFALVLVLAILAVTQGVPWPVASAVAAALFLLAVLTLGKHMGPALGNKDIAVWVISNRVLPPVAVVLPIFILFQQFGLLDTRAALIMTYTAINLPLVVWLMRDYFETIPVELEEHAAIDGASRYRIFWSITLPLAGSGLVATFLLLLVFTWNEYLLALFLSSANAQTMPLLVAAQHATRGPQWWYMSVLILIMIVPVVVMAIVLERYISRGLLIGAVKG
jgi:multiple sugar transport system permease protein